MAPPLLSLLSGGEAGRHRGTLCSGLLLSVSPPDRAPSEGAEQGGGPPPPAAASTGAPPPSNLRAPPPEVQGRRPGRLWWSLPAHLQRLAQSSSSSMRMVLTGLRAGGVAPCEAPPPTEGCSPKREC